MELTASANRAFIAFTKLTHVIAARCPAAGRADASQDADSKGDIYCAGSDVERGQKRKGRKGVKKGVSPRVSPHNRQSRREKNCASITTDEACDAMKMTKRVCMKRTIRMFALLLAGSNALAQGTLSFAVPNAQANAEGNSSTSDPFSSSSFRFQQVFDASQFGSTPFIINSIAFRIDGASTGPVGWSFGGSTIQFSTTTQTPESLSPVFADNIGSDVTTVRNGAIPIGGNFQPGASPQPFGSGITMTSPFLYNPAQGNLLLDITAGGGLTLFPGALDAQSVSGDSISRVYATSAGASAGVSDSLGLITRFNVTVVPEPSSWLLAGVGLVFAAILRLVRRQ